MFVACLQVLGMNSLTDVPKPNEFGFTISAWMKSDMDRRSEHFVKRLSTNMSIFHTQPLTKGVKMTSLTMRMMS